MKDNTFNLKEIKFLDSLQEFFGIRTVINHLTFIDKWMELLLGGKLHKKWTKPGDLYFFYEKVEGLFAVSHQLQETLEGHVTFEENITVKNDLLSTEKQTLDYFPYQLKEQELLNPVKAIRAVFKKHNLSYYQQMLQEWIVEGLNNNYTTDNAVCIIPLYNNAKKLIMACWLIHERAITKNSFKSPIYTNPLLNFALTEPYLFFDEEANDPYSRIESFFSFTNLSGYRTALLKWYELASSEDLAEENPNDLLFMHNQYVQLIQAGYLIVAQKLAYIPKSDKYNGKTFGQWLFDIRDHQAEIGEIASSDEEPHLLSLAERAAPMDYCGKTLSHSNVIKLRFGLREWLDAGLSRKSSIHILDKDYVFGQYLILQKLTEAFYIIITQNTTAAS